MCLEIKSGQKGEIAKRDITCYKVVIDNGRYVTPYRESLVKIGNTYESEVIVKLNTYIHVGLHSFRTIKFAELERRWWSEHAHRGLIKSAVIIKCLIPKGSLYYKGMFDNENDCYVSSSIKYIELRIKK